MYPITSDRPALALPARHRILVVEDFAASAQALRLLLEALGQEVRVAGDGVAGVALALDWKPDLVLCDIGLPRLDGFGVADALRPTSVRLVALTGCADATTCRLALRCSFEQ